MITRFCSGLPGQLLIFDEHSLTNSYLIDHRKSTHLMSIYVNGLNAVKDR